MRLSRVASVYIGVAVVSAALLMSFSPPSLTNKGLSYPLIFLFLLIIAESYSTVWTRGGHFKPSFSLLLPLFAVCGTGWLQTISFIARLVQDGLLSKRSWYATLFNASRYVISSAGASSVYYRLGGEVPGGDLLEGSLGPVIGFMITFFLINHFLRTGYGYLSGELKDTFKTRIAKFIGDGFTYLLISPAALLFLAAILHGGMFGMVLVAASVLSLSHVLGVYAQATSVNRELLILYDVAHRVNAALDLEKTFEVVADAIGRLFGCDGCGLFIWDDANSELYLAAAQVSGDEEVKVKRIKPEEGIIGSVAASRKPRIVNEFVPTGQNAGLCSSIGSSARSLMAIPLLAEGELVGVLAVGRRQRGAYNREHLRLLTILGSQVAVAIENALLYRKTEYLAITDPMTELYNIRYFHAQLERELKKARAVGGKFSVIYLDMDNFKQYNDLFGHQTGDKVLKEVSEIIKKNVRATDIPARYAGDEFIILLPDTERKEAEQVAARIQSSIRTHKFQGLSDMSVPEVTVSTGISTYPDDGNTEEVLIDIADKSMYREKGHIH